MVGGHRITKHDIDSVLATAPVSIRQDYTSDVAQYKELVERIANQEAMYLAAQKAGTAEDTEYRADVRAQQKQLLLRHYYQNALRALPAIPDTSVREYYEGHKAEFNMPGRARVRHIQVATRARAREVIKKLGTESWDQVASRYSTDKLTARNGGVLGFVGTDSPLVPGVGNAPAIVAAAFRLKEGETGEPLKSEKAWHVIRADERTEAGPQPFRAVERQIRTNLENQRTERFQETLVDSLKKVYGVVVFDDVLLAAMSPVSSPAELFARAQTTGSPPERIELFQQVVKKFPDDKSAVQAAFMVGFTYAEELKDYPAARAAFENFIVTYPKSDLVSSAKWMLENMENSTPPPSVGIPDTLLLIPRPGSPPGGTNSKP